MITRKYQEGMDYVTYHEGEYWIETDAEGTGRTVMFHTCPMGADCNVLLVEETFNKECSQCGPVKLPDDLWTLYVLLDGRGVYKDVE
jgi:hypothetical protein